ncbi:MBL fold metallo-hydrolase [Pseudoalteromonas sp. T1lg65]|uniref:MBL fold metallo-hydrolase n=1 Tax=Pseudoalteromonas sp. T1lg65 TaxID=2077101 RepID=UPI003F79E2A5
MNKIKISDNFYQYQFPPLENCHFGFNIYALIDGNEALLIDTAFESQAKAVKEDLAQHGITISKVVFSHFHPDHTSGLPELDTPILYGNALYQESLNKYTPENKHHYFEGLSVLTEGDTMTFGSFNLAFTLVQGHVDCAMFTIINNEFVHVADDIMESNEGVPLLPSVHVSNAQKHVSSLELLKRYKSCTLLPSHGNAISGEITIVTAIEERQKYLQAVADSDTPIPIDTALQNCNVNFLHKEWHEYVYI